MVQFVSFIEGGPALLWTVLAYDVLDVETTLTWLWSARIMLTETKSYATRTRLLRVIKPIYVSEYLSTENKSLHATTRARVKEICHKFVSLGLLNDNTPNETSRFIHIKNEQVLDTLG